MTERHLPAQRAESLPAFDAAQPREMIMRGLARLAAQPPGGTLKWRFTTERNQYPPYVLRMGENGLLYVSADSSNTVLRKESNCVYALDLLTGRPSWSFAADCITGSDNGVVRVLRAKETIDGAGTISGLDEATGREIWRFTVGSILGSFFLEPGVETICVKEPQGDVRAMAALTGAEIWHSKFADKETHFPLFWTTANGIIYAGSSNGKTRFQAPHTIFAIDATTGRELWRFLNAELNHTQVKIEAGTVYFWGTNGPLRLKDRSRGSTSRYDTTLYALDATTGETRWKWTAPGQSAQLRLANGLVYWSSWGKVIHVLDPETGTDIGNEAAVIPSQPTAGTYWADNMVYLPAANGVEGRKIGYPQDVQESYVSAVDATTRVEHWRFAAEGHAVKTIAVMNGLVLVWFVTEDENWDGEHWGGTGTLYGLDAVTGLERLRVAPVSSPTIIPAKIDSLVFIVTQVFDEKNDEFRVIAVDTRDGSERWTCFTSDDDLFIVSSGIFYLIGDCDTVHALNISTGVELWNFTTEGNSVRSLMADSETFYVSNGGNVYAIHSGVAE